LVGGKYAFSEDRLVVSPPPGILVQYAGFGRIIVMRASDPERGNPPAALSRLGLTNESGREPLGING